MIKLINNNCENDGINKVFSFGISSGASKELVEGSALAGKGDFTFVLDSQLETLKVEVINML